MPGGIYCKIAMAEEKEKNLMTVEQFNATINEWAEKVRRASGSSLQTGTHGTGKLRESLTPFVDSYDKQSPAYKVAFRFLRYGVFRAYGVGRGYIAVNGTVVRGGHTTTLQQVRDRRLRIIANRAADGLTKTQLRRSKIGGVDDKRAIKRKPLDWIDGHLNGSVGQLADAVQAYYGDAALRNMLAEFKKTKIVKQ